MVNADSFPAWIIQDFRIEKPNNYYRMIITWLLSNNNAVTVENQ